MIGSAQTYGYGAGAGPGGKSYYGGDLESGPDALYPGITTSEQGLRWGFIQKVRVCAEREALGGCGV
jgi:hypothetical protein